MSVNATQPAEASGGNTNAFEIGQLDPPVIADHHILDAAFAIDQRANLPPGFVRKLGELPSNFWCNHLVGRNSSGIELLYPPQLIRL